MMDLLKFIKSIHSFIYSKVLYPEGSQVDAYSIPFADFYHLI